MVDHAGAHQVSAPGLAHVHWLVAGRHLVAVERGGRQARAGRFVVGPAGAGGAFDQAAGGIPALDHALELAQLPDAAVPRH